MGKRKEANQCQSSSEDSTDSERALNEGEVETVDVDFEFFDPEEIDYQGLRTLLNQLFGADSELIDTTALVDLIIQDSFGSTVKVDGKQNDPYAFLAVLSLKHHWNNSGIQRLIHYVLEKAKSEDSLYGKLSRLMTMDSEFQLGLVFSERLINMPHEVAPPMYRMLVEDINSLCLPNMPPEVAQDKECNFDYYLIISRAFNELNINRSSKKTKTKTESENTAGFFHLEDAVFHKHSLASCLYPLTISSRDKILQEVGINPQGCLILMKKENMLKCITEIQSHT